MDDIPTVCGTVDVRLDDGRCLQTRHGDLLAALADLAQHRAVLDTECDLVLDPLPAPSDSGVLVLHVRLGVRGAEIGARHTTCADLDGALTAGWHHVHRYAERTDNQGLMDEMLIPHAEHYWPPALTARA